MDSIGLLLLVLVIYVIIKFNRPLTKLIKVAEESVDISDDTVRTYASDVYIMNAQKRDKQKKEIDKIENVITNDEIKDLLKSKKVKAGATAK
jgi:hypothetical protein